MDPFLGSPFAQISTPDPPPPPPPQQTAPHPQQTMTPQKSETSTQGGSSQHPRPISRPPPPADSWSAQQSSLALRFYRLGLPGVAEMVLSAPKLDTSALMRDAAVLEGGDRQPPVAIPRDPREHLQLEHTAAAAAAAGTSGVSTPPETPSTAARARPEKSDRLISQKAKSIMDLKQAEFDIQLLLGRISAIEYDPLDPSLSDIPDAAKPYAGFLLGLVKCYTETDDEHEKKTLQCVALYHLHLVFDGLVRNYRGKDARAKASEVLSRVMSEMPMAKSATSFVTLATASRWLRELCDYMGGARFSQHLLYVRGDFTITNFKQMLTSSERLRLIKEALAEAREYYRSQLDSLYGTFIPQYVPAFYGEALQGR
ncbi:hypothetical protein RUND412_001633 [Rhizina undulata]